MTDQHPITPPPEQVQQWLNHLWGCPGPEPTTDDLFIAARAAAWGADMELEACCKWLVDMQNPRWAMALQEDRRPKLKSLAEKSLDLIDKIQSNKKMWQIEELDVVRRALERLQELEENQ